MKLSELQFTFPKIFVRTTAGLLESDIRHRFILVKTGDLTLEFRSGLVTNHKDLATEDERVLIEGGGYISSGADPKTEKRWLFVGEKSAQFDAVPVRVCRLLGEKLRTILPDEPFDEVRTEPRDMPLHPFWKVVEIDA